jgi:hypothetical protein
MSDEKYEIEPEVNPKARQAHKSQVLWQITIPFFVIVALFLAVALLVIVSGARGNGTISMWADISLIWLIMPVLLILLVILAINGGLLYGIIKLIGVLPGIFFKLQRVLSKIHEKVEAGSNAAAAPFIKASSLRAAIKALMGR